MSNKNKLTSLLIELQIEPLSLLQYYVVQNFISLGGTYLRHKFDVSMMHIYCSIALFCSEEKGKLFVPNAEKKSCVIVSSSTGKLLDIDIEAVKRSIQIFDVSLALA